MVINGGAGAADAPAVADACAQPSPQEMAKAAGVTLPKLPWHVVNIWWEFEKPTEHFESLAVDVTIDRDVPVQRCSNWSGDIGERNGARHVFHPLIGQGRRACGSGAQHVIEGK